MKSDLYKAIMITSGGLSGGVASTISGGNFWQGARQGLITSGLNHGLHEIADDWLTTKMELKEVKQRYDYDCVFACTISAAETLLDINVSDKVYGQDGNNPSSHLKLAKEKGGVPASSIKNVISGLGLKAAEFQWGDRTMFSEGIRKGGQGLAIKFIVQSMNAGHPVLVGFQNSEMPMGHASLISEIKYKSDFSALKTIKLINPDSGSSTPTSINSFDSQWNNRIYKIISIQRK